MTLDFHRHVLGLNGAGLILWAALAVVFLAVAYLVVKERASAVLALIVWMLLVAVSWAVVWLAARLIA